MKDQEINKKRKRNSTQKASKPAMSTICFNNRCGTVQKKAFELSKLCNIDVCVICYAPDGSLYTFPENRNNAREIAMKFKNLDEKTRSKRSVNLAGFSKEIQDDKRSKFKSLKKALDGYSKEELIELDNVLLSKLQKLQERSEILKQQKQEQENRIQPAATVDQNLILSEFTEPNLTGDFVSDFDWLQKNSPEEDSSSNNGAIVQFQNQEFNYSDMNGINNISNANSLVPVDHTARNQFQGFNCSDMNANSLVPVDQTARNQFQGFNYSDMIGNNNISNVNCLVPVDRSLMVPHGYNNCFQFAVPQTQYQNLSQQMIGTPSAYNRFNPVQPDHTRIGYINNNYAAMGIVENPYVNLGDGVFQNVNNGNNIVMNNGNFQSGYPPLMVSNSLHQGFPAMSWGQQDHQQFSGNFPYC